MAKLLYVSPMSLDGYIGDGNYEWSNPGEEGHDFITEIIRPIGTYLYGRKTYETMAVWEAMDAESDSDPAIENFSRVWKAADKIVYSKTLTNVTSQKTRIEREFDVNSIRKLKAQLDKDITVGGPNLGAQAIRAGLVDEYHFFVVPMMIGGGIRVFPPEINVTLQLLEERRFGDGWLYLRYKDVKENK